MRLFKKILALAFTAFAFLVLFALQLLSDFDGFDIRLVPLDKAGFLAHIEDDRARAVFAGLSVTDIVEKGARDRLTSSRWCGLNPGEADSLFDIGFVRNSSPEDFVAAQPITKPYLRFGIGGPGNIHFGVGVEPAGDCLDFYLTEFY